MVQIVQPTTADLQPLPNRKFRCSSDQAGFPSRVPQKTTVGCFHRHGNQPGLTFPWPFLLSACLPRPQFFSLLYYQDLSLVSVSLIFQFHAVLNLLGLKGNQRLEVLLFSSRNCCNSHVSSIQNENPVDLSG